MPIILSKSRFVAGCQCLKRLYLQVHQPELAAQPNDAGEAIMDQGREVGLLARRLFSGGIEVDGSGSVEQAIRVTKELLINPEVPAIFEGAFRCQGVVVKTDVLQRKGNRWRLVEVKSTTDLKEHHTADVAVQSYVVSRSGVALGSVWLAHVNRDYVLAGEAVDARQFFLFRNLTGRVQSLQPTIALQVRSQFRALDMPSPPDIPPGPHCTNPVVCEFFSHCNPPKPEDYIGYLPRLHASAMEHLEEMGVESIRDIPADFVWGQPNYEQFFRGKWVTLLGSERR
jgi:predicted RecB family nuclease